MCRTTRTADAVQATRAAGGRVVAVGTTVVRALESAADAHGRVIASPGGWTGPGDHPPSVAFAWWTACSPASTSRGASHLAMLEAIAGRPHLAIAYQAALDGRYLWHEFGDLHLTLSPDGRSGMSDGQAGAVPGQGCEAQAAAPPAS